MNDALRRLEQLVGDWDVTLTHAWFLESLDTEIHGTATVEWYADAFLLLHGAFPGRTPEEGGSAWWMAFARNDPRDAKRDRPFRVGCLVDDEAFDRKVNLVLLRQSPDEPH